MPRDIARARSVCRICGDRCKVAPRRLALFDRNVQVRDWVFTNAVLCPSCHDYLLTMLGPWHRIGVGALHEADGRMWGRREIRRQGHALQRMLRQLDHDRHDELLVDELELDGYVSWRPSMNGSDHT